MLDSRGGKRYECFLYSKIPQFFKRVFDCAGLGYSLGKKWASKGYQVVVTRRSSSDPEEIRKEIGESAVAFPCDVTDAEQVSELVDMVEVKFGPIEMLLYNAGSGVFKTFDEVSIEEFEKSFSTNATGLLSAAKAVCPRMQERGFGVVGITGRLKIPFWILVGQ